MQRLRRSGSVMRAPPNSVVSTAVFLTSHPQRTSHPYVKCLEARECIAPVNSFDRIYKGFSNRVGKVRRQEAEISIFVFWGKLDTMLLNKIFLHLF